MRVDARPVDRHHRGECVARRSTVDVSVAVGNAAIGQDPQSCCAVHRDARIGVGDVTQQDGARLGGGAAAHAADGRPVARRHRQVSQQVGCELYSGEIDT